MGPSGSGVFPCDLQALPCSAHASSPSPSRTLWSGLHQASVTEGSCVLVPGGGPGPSPLLDEGATFLHRGSQGSNNVHTEKSKLTEFFANRHALPLGLAGIHLRICHNSL